MSPSQNDLNNQLNAFPNNMFEGSSNNSFSSQDHPFSLLPPHLQQSMTLPVIQSNLNPYAPDFTSRHLGTSVTATHGTASSIGSMGGGGGPMGPNLVSPFAPPGVGNLVPTPSLGGVSSNPPRIAGLMDSVNAVQKPNGSNIQQPNVSLFGLAFPPGENTNGNGKNPIIQNPLPPPPHTQQQQQQQQQPPLPSTNVVTHLPPPPPPLIMPPSSRHPPPSHLMPGGADASSQQQPTLGGIPNLMNVQPLSMPGGASDSAGSNNNNNNPAAALFNMNLLAATPGSSGFGMMPPPPPPPPAGAAPPQNSSNLSNPAAAAALDAMLRPGLTPTKKDQAALSKFAATIGMIPPPGSGSPHSNNSGVDLKMPSNKPRPDNSIFGTDFSFMDGMPLRNDESRMWSHKSGDGFGGGAKTPNFGTGVVDPMVAPPLSAIGSHPPGSGVNDGVIGGGGAKLDNNAFASPLNFGPGFFGGVGVGGNNGPNAGAPLPSAFGSLGVPFGGIGGNGNGSGDAGTTPLPPFPMLWGNSGLGGLKNMGGGLGGLKNMGGGGGVSGGLGGFSQSSNSEAIPSSAGDAGGDSGAGNWNGNAAPRS